VVNINFPVMPEMYRKRETELAGKNGSDKKNLHLLEKGSYKKKEKKVDRFKK